MQTSRGQDSDKAIEKVLVNFRIKCDVAVSELKDNFYTQEQYEDAIAWELDHATSAIRQLLAQRSVVLPEKESGWTIELPDLPYFQIKAFDKSRFNKEWVSPIYDTKNLPLTVNMKEKL